MRVSSVQITKEWVNYKSQDSAYECPPSTADVVLTSKHHEGWCNFRNSYHWNWNSIDVGPKRDLVGDLTASVRAAGLHMGLYHSLREWYNPLYIMDNNDNCSTTAFVDEVLTPTLKQMVEEYQVSSARWGSYLASFPGHSQIYRKIISPQLRDKIEWWG